MTVSLTRLRHILAVARTGSISVAAEEEAISQPALSRSIQAFEEHYNLRLFDRSRGGVTLTPAGALAVQQAKAVLSAAGALDRNMTLYGKGHAGRIGIGFGPLIGSMLIPHLAAELLNAHPALQLVTRIMAADQLVDALFEGAIEAIIGNSGHLDQLPGVQQQKIGSFELAIAVRDGHPLMESRALSLDALSGYPMASAVETPIISAMENSGSLVSENFHILRDVVLKTDCVWLTSPSFIRTDLESGRMRLLPVLDLQPREADIWIAYRRQRSSSPLLPRVIEHAKALLAREQ